MSISSGIHQLAGLAYSRLLEADPRQAQSAKRFIDHQPPAPQPGWPMPPRLTSTPLTDRESSRPRPRCPRMAKGQRAKKSQPSAYRTSVSDRR